MGSESSIALDSVCYKLSMKYNYEGMQM